MIFVPLAELRSGMKLADEIVVFYKAPVILLQKGDILTDRYIQRMKMFDVGGAYITDGRNDDIIPPKPVIDGALRAEAVHHVRSIYQCIEKGINQSSTESIQALQSVVSRLATSLANHKDTLINIAELKCYDDCTYRHSLSVAVISLAIGLEMHFSPRELQRIGLCAILHDIGKMSMPLDVLNKPDKLTGEEYELIKQHAAQGSIYLELNHLTDNEIVMGVKYHHEKVDGKGYPDGIGGDKIPLYSKIIAVADVYDALTSFRPYRTPMQPSEAAEYLMGNCNTSFDLRVVQSFLRCVELYPIGSCVRLSDGRRCVVISNKNTLRPVVRLLDPPYEELDLFEDSELYNTVIEFAYQTPPEGCPRNAPAESGEVDGMKAEYKST